VAKPLLWFIKKFAILSTHFDESMVFVVDFFIVVTKERTQEVGEGVGMEITELGERKGFSAELRRSRKRNENAIKRFGICVV
jgi:hypothetical protein